MDQFTVFARALLATVLVASALHKLRGRNQMGDSIEKLIGFEVGLGAKAAIAVGLLEACVVGCLLAPATVVVGLVASALVMLVYTGLIAVAVGRRSTASCNCFGDGGAPVSWLTFVRNLALLGCSLVPSTWYLLSLAPAGVRGSVADIAPALLGFAVGYMIVNSGGIEEFWHAAADEEGGYAT